MVGEVVFAYQSLKLFLLQSLKLAKLAEGLQMIEYIINVVSLFSQVSCLSKASRGNQLCSSTCQLDPLGICVIFEFCVLLQDDVLLLKNAKNVDHAYLFDFVVTMAIQIQNCLHHACIYTSYGFVNIRWTTKENITQITFKKIPLNIVNCFEQHELNLFCG